MVLAIFAVAAAEPREAEGGLRISAQVDKTEVDLGSQLTLTITLEGDFAQVELQPFEFPKALRVVSQSRASNVSMRLGDVKRSVNLVYVLIAQEPGHVQLGPFQAIHQGKPLLTDPIDITISKPPLPPGIEDRQRYTL